MITDFTVGGETIALSLNADTEQIITETSPGLIALGKLLREKELHHYYLTNDYKIFLDETKGVSWAAEITERWPEEYEIDPGEYLVFVPGDESVYHARITVSPSAINVAHEQILNLTDSLELINQEPTRCLTKRSGSLARQFDEHQIEMLSQLPIETDPDESGYHLHYGLDQLQIFMIPGLLVLAIILLVLTPALIRGVGAWLSPPAPPPPPPTPPSISRSTLDRDLMSVSSLMQHHAVLVLHGLSSFKIEPGQEQFRLIAKGALGPSTTLQRLQELNLARNGTFSFERTAWTMQFTDHRYTEIPEKPPENLYNQVDHWRLTSARHNFALAFTGEEILHDAKRYTLSLSFDSPLPPQLRALASDIHSQGLYAETKTINLAPGQDGQTWTSLTLTMTITGTTP